MTATLRERPRRLLFLCNALDDSTRLQRGIWTDSPAASRKVFMMLDAMRQYWLFPHAISMGRGQSLAPKGYFGGFVRRARRFGTIYMPFSNRRWISELLTLVAPIFILWRLRKSAVRTTVLLYNRERPYVLALLAARLLGYRVALDLEDGEVGSGGVLRRLRQQFFDACITDGALLACSALGRWTKVRPLMCYYGIADAVAGPRDWHAPRLCVLLGGSLSQDTGVNLLAAAIEWIRANAPDWAASLEFHVSGKGDALPVLERLAGGDVAPRVIVHGRMTDEAYRELLARMHVGLALKIHNGAFAQTTFPSKVTEMAGNGLLVLSTDISDVRALLGGGARFIESDDPMQLVERLREIATMRDEAEATAVEGQLRIREVCARVPAGENLARFLFPAMPRGAE